MDALLAISPVDGRYYGKTESLSEFFSEFALMRYRVRTEVEYLIALSEIPIPRMPEMDERTKAALRTLYESFSLEDAKEIKEIEKTTNHDVKAVEYFIKRRFDSEFVHFGLTSQDINNTAVPCSLRDAVEKVYIPELETLLSMIESCVERWRDIPMLAHTHGQPASPTRVGKEFEVFAVRLAKQLEALRRSEYPAKFGGATGGMNAHYVAYPDIDWKSFADNFVKNALGLTRSYPTTQIDHYDGLAAIFDNMRRINVILIDMCRDIWSYISMGYFKQKIKEGEVGSSAMPHKVNPIDFENAEGNLGIADAIFGHLSEKLPISRLQRDLTDSTVLRNVGVPMAHSLIAFKSLEKGLGKIMIDVDRMASDLEDNWAVVAEALQTILRREGYPKPYETLKALTRTGEHVTERTISSFIDTLDVSEDVKAELHAITPLNYVGR